MGKTGQLRPEDAVLSKTVAMLSIVEHREDGLVPVGLERESDLRVQPRPHARSDRDGVRGTGLDREVIHVRDREATRTPRPCSADPPWRDRESSRRHPGRGRRGCGHHASGELGAHAVVRRPLSPGGRDALAHSRSLAVGADSLAHGPDAFDPLVPSTRREHRASIVPAAVHPSRPSQSPLQGGSARVVERLSFALSSGPRPLHRSRGSSSA
jgi:hypothetical protein